MSIDLDVLFDEMPKYQEYMDVDLTPSQSWTVVGWKDKSLTYEPNDKCLQQLLKIIHRCCAAAKPYLIMEHNEIVKYLEEDSIVWNCDYHHDISYCSDDSELNIENWVKHGFKKGLIKEYNWITRPDAVCPVGNTIPYGIKLLDTVDILTLPKFEKVVICVSKHFTPKKHWGYGQLLYDYIRQEVVCS